MLWKLRIQTKFQRKFLLFYENVARKELNNDFSFHKSVITMRYMILLFKQFSTFLPDNKLFYGYFGYRFRIFL